MTHPAEHKRSATYWAHYLGGMIEAALVHLRAGRVDIAEQVLDVAADDYAKSQFHSHAQTSDPSASVVER